MTQKTVVIAGATGLVGNRLQIILANLGYTIHVLSTNPKQSSKKNVFNWSIKNNFIDTNVFRNADVVINLAGAGIAEKPWSKQRKQEIYNSRILGTRLLRKTIQENAIPINKYISASGVGYYPSNSGVVFTEESENGTGYVPELTRDWESEIFAFSDVGIAATAFRIGIVLEKDKGFLGALANPMRFYAGAILGTGKQTISWIHVEDLCAMIVRAIDENSMQGVYNAVAPQPVSLKEITLKLAAKKKSKILLPNVPNFMLKLLFGERSTLMLSDQFVVANKIMDEGFKFKFSELDAALDNLYG